MAEHRLKISERLREAMAYEKLAGPAPRLLVLRSEYWLDGAALNAAERLGWEIASVRVAQEGLMARESVEALLSTLIHFRPDFVLTVNLAAMDLDGVFARLFEDLGVPFVTWFVDDPRTIIMERTCFGGPLAIAVTWEEAYEPYLRRMGFAHVHTLPLAVDATLFNAEPLDAPDLPPSFVGNSMRQFADAKWAELRQYPAVATAVEEAFAAGRVNRTLFGEGIEAMVGTQAAHAMDAEQRRLAEMVCFIEGTRRIRREYVTALVQEGLVPRGDPGWAIESECALGPVPYMTELPEFYRRCALSFNTTSIQMPNTVNQRVFDCPAAGGFVLTDAQPALEALFDIGTEAIWYHDVFECVELFRFYRRHPEARRAITRRARRRILAEHTYGHRLETIAGWVKAHFGG